jgi:hypothetical protein
VFLIYQLSFNLRLNGVSLSLFNNVKSQIRCKWVNKERKIKTKVDKEFQNFEGG